MALCNAPTNILAWSTVGPLAGGGSIGRNAQAISTLGHFLVQAGSGHPRSPAIDDGAVICGDERRWEKEFSKAALPQDAKLAVSFKVSTLLYVLPIVTPSGRNRMSFGAILSLASHRMSDTFQQRVAEAARSPSRFGGDRAPRRETAARLA